MSKEDYEDDPKVTTTGGKDQVIKVPRNPELFESIKSSYEVRMVDPETGGMKGSKPVQLGWIDPLALERVGEVAGFGAEKYEKFNYLKGYDWSLSINALYRHFLRFLDGEDNDPESGLPHMAHAAWQCLALVSFAERGLGTDDRFKDGIRE
jgi:hypothetical protein